VDVDGVAAQVVKALKVKADLCEQKKDSLSESSEVLNDISQLNVEVPANDRSDSLNLSTAGAAL
jgi:hypothetical protein